MSRHVIQMTTKLMDAALMLSDNLPASLIAMLLVLFGRMYADIELEI